MWNKQFCEQIHEDVEELIEAWTQSKAAIQSIDEYDLELNNGGLQANLE